MKFDEYLKEEISKDDIKKAKEVGIATAKEVFGDDFDEKKANETIDGMIKDHKDKAEDGEDLSAIVANAFR
jgi:fructose-specific phosphotransferase system component IIB